MSVIVNGMKMPNSCTMCWLNTFCGVWNVEPVKHKGFNERLEDCPLTELIRCKDCRWFINKECAIYCLSSAHEETFCSYAEPKDSTAEVRRQLKETEQRKEMERKK